MKFSPSLFFAGLLTIFGWSCDKGVLRRNFDCNQFIKSIKLSPGLFLLVIDYLIVTETEKHVPLTTYVSITLLSSLIIIH